MAPQSLETKVESLEERVTRLEELPGRMDRFELQIVQFRTEVRDEFSALREAIRSRDDLLRHELVTLRLEMRSGDDETRRFMRVLFEEYIGRLRLIDEGKNPNT